MSSSDAAPAEWSTHKDAGNAAYAASDFATAVEAYTQALKCDIPDKDRATVLCNRAQCLLKQRAFAAAVEDCSASLTLSPDNVKALFRRASAFEAMGNSADAIRDYQEALRLQPTLTQARQGLERLDPARFAPARPAATEARRSAPIVSISPEDMRALAEAESRVKEVARQMKQARDKHLSTLREKRLLELQVKSVEEMPPTVPTYRAIGKMFLATERPALSTHLAEKMSQAEQKLRVCTSTIEFLTRQEKAAEEHFLDTVKTVQTHAGIATRGSAKTK